MIANEQALSRELLAVSKSRATYEAALENAGKWLVELADNRGEEDERASRRIGVKPAWSNTNSAFFQEEPFLSFQIGCTPATLVFLQAQETAHVSSWPTK
jgi:hypothetical protein